MFTTDNDTQVQFNTFESKSLIDSIFPQLIKAFQEAQRRKQQGKNELERRKRYGGLAQSMISNQSQQRPDYSKKQPIQKRKRAARERNFDIERRSKHQKRSVDETKRQGVGNDVNMLMNNLPSTASSDDTSLSPSVDDEDGNEIVEDVRKWERPEFAAQGDCVDLNNSRESSAFDALDDSDEYDCSRLKSYEKSNEEHPEVNCYQQYNELLDGRRQSEEQAGHSAFLTDQTSAGHSQLHLDNHYDYDYNAYTLESDEQWLQKEYDAPSSHNREGYEYNYEAADAASVDLRKRNERVFCNFGIQIEVTPLGRSGKDWFRF